MKPSDFDTNFTTGKTEGWWDDNVNITEEEAAAIDAVNPNREGPARKKQKTGKERGKGKGGQRSRGGVAMVEAEEDSEENSEYSEEEEEEEGEPPRRQIGPTRGAATLPPPFGYACYACPPPHLCQPHQHPGCWRGRGDQPPGTGFICSVLCPSPSQAAGGGSSSHSSQEIRFSLCPKP